MAIKIEVKRNEPIDRALRRLKKEMAGEGIMRDLKERRYFQKPGDKKRKKSAAARKRRAMDKKAEARTGL
jgi:small subunit ribosomal protein S21